MELEGQKFPVRDKDGQIRQAELLERANFNGKDFAFYALENQNDTVDIYTSYIVKGEDGYEYITDITDDEDMIWAVEHVNEIINSTMGE